jgi:hypothetical protein
VKAEKGDSGGLWVNEAGEAAGMQVLVQDDIAWIHPMRDCPESGFQTAKRSKIIAQAFRPGNQCPAKCALKGRHTHVSVSLTAFFQLERRSVVPTGQFSSFHLPGLKAWAIDL